VSVYRVGNWPGAMPTLKVGMLRLGATPDDRRTDDPTRRMQPFDLLSEIFRQEAHNGGR